MANQIFKITLNDLRSGFHNFSRPRYILKHRCGSNMWVQLIAIYRVYICKLPVDKDSGVEAKPVILASAVAARLMLAALKAFACPA